MTNFDALQTNYIGESEASQVISTQTVRQDHLSFYFLVPLGDLGGLFSFLETVHNGNIFEYGRLWSEFHY